MPTSSVTFTWTVVTGTLFYEFAILPGTLSAHPITTTAATYELHGLAPGTVHHWQVFAVRRTAAGLERAAADGGTLFQFTTAGGTPPAPPGAFSKLAPADGATGVPTATVVLSWEDSAGALAYKVCVGTASASCNFGLFETHSTVYTLPLVLPNTTYYWQVKAQNALGWKEANDGASWTFATVAGPAPAPPGAFGKVSPANAATDVPTQAAMLEWAPSEGALYYHVCLGLSPNLCNVADMARVFSTSVTLPRLWPSQTYYWQVKAVNLSGLTKADGGLGWSFSTVGDPALAPPGAFSKTAPAEGATGVPVSGASFTWQSSPQASFYELCIGLTNAGCVVSMITTRTEVILQPALLRPDTRYVWQVTAMNRAGRTPANGGQRWAFTTAAGAGKPGPFGKISPADGATDVPPTGITLSWQTSAGAAFYHLCIGHAANTCNLVFATKDTHFSHPMLKLLPNATYYWQVKAFNSAGYTPADGGQFWSFTTAAPAAAARLLAIYALAFDNDPTSPMNLSAYYRPVIQSIISATIGQPDKVAVVLADLDQVGDTHALIIRNGVAHSVPGLPGPTVALSRTLREIDMTNPAVLGGFIQWARKTVSATTTVFSFIGHGAALFPDTALANVFGAPSALDRQTDTVYIGTLPTHIGVHPDFTDAHPRAMLSTYDLAEALRIGTQDGARPIQVVDIVHCFAATIEEMFPLRAFAQATTASPNYAYFSPDMPGAMLSALTPGAAAGQLAQDIVQAYDALLPAEEHPRILAAVDNSRLADLKAAWDALSGALMDSLNADEAGAKVRITQAYTASAKYDTTLCQPQDWQLAPPDALSDMAELAAQLQTAFGAGSAVGDQAALAADLLGQAVITTVVRNGTPWFARVSPPPVWTFTGRGVAIYSDFQGMDMSGQTYLSYHADWYTDTASAANPHPYAFLQRGGGAVWADVVQRFWSGTPYQTAACLPSLPPIDQSGEVAVARILGPLTRTTFISAHLPLQAVITVAQITFNPLVRFEVSGADGQPVFSETVGTGYLITGSHFVDASRHWIPGAAGQYTLTVAIDPDDRISETNELDNSKTAVIVVRDNQIEMRPVITAAVAGDLQWIASPSLTLEIHQSNLTSTVPVTRLFVQVYQFVTRTHPLRLVPTLIGRVIVDPVALPLATFDLPAATRHGSVVLHVWAESSAGRSMRPAEVWFNYTPPDTPIAQGQEHYYVFKGTAGESYQIFLDVPAGGDANLFVWYPYNHLTPDEMGVSVGSDTVAFDAPLSGFYLVAVRGETAGGTTYTLALTPNQVPDVLATGSAASEPAAIAEAAIPSQRPAVDAPIPDPDQDVVFHTFIPLAAR